MNTVPWIKVVVAVAALAAGSIRADEWRQVAFIGNAKVFNVSGVVETLKPREGRVLRDGEKLRAGETYKIWQGAELVLQMESSGSLVRAKGPVILRLAPEKEGFDRASITGQEDRVGFVARAIRGKAEYQAKNKWRPLHTGDVLPEGARIRAEQGATLDFYHNTIGTVIRVTEPERTLVAKPVTTGAQDTLAAKAP